MEASLVHLILHQATVSPPHISQHLAEYPFQGVVAHLTPRLAHRLHGLVTIVTNIKGSAIEMA